jgi:hypothetical protein
MTYLEQIKQLNIQQKLLDNRIEICADNIAKVHDDLCTNAEKYFACFDEGCDESKLNRLLKIRKGMIGQLQTYALELNKLTGEARSLTLQALQLL